MDALRWALIGGMPISGLMGLRRKTEKADSFEGSTGSFEGSATAAERWGVLGSEP